MNPVTGLSLGRIAIGATALATPDLAVKLFRLDGPGNPQLPYMTRMFASREIALGIITLAARGRSRRAIVALGIVVDGSDAFAAWDAGRRGAVSQPTSMALAGPALGAVVSGALGAVRRQPR